jgi:hypothetical protein
MYRLNEEQTGAIEERRRVADALASMELDRKNFLGDECKSSAMS